MKTQRSWNTHTLLVENKNGATTLGKILEVHLSVKHIGTTWPSNFTPDMYTTEMKTHAHTKDWTWMVTAVTVMVTLFTKVKK